MVQAATHSSPQVEQPAGEADARCAMADRAAVGMLQPLLARNRPADAGVIERAVHGLNIARKHCAYGWTASALDDYGWVERWAAENR